MSKGRAGLTDDETPAGKRTLWRERRWAAPLFLAVASPVLAEVLSGNLPLPVFIPLLPLMLIAYGIPVLLIRDAWVRFGLGVPGLFVLGLAYGFVNEALFAKTVFMDVQVPVDSFDGYGGSGVNWAWSSFIVPWHALHSVLYPIAFTWWLFPQRRSEPWLSRRLSLILFAVMMIVGAAIHTASDPAKGVDPGTLASLLFSVVAIGIPVLIAWRLPRRPKLLEPGSTRRGMAPTGIAVAALLILMAAASEAHPPAVVLIAISAAFFAVFAVVLHRRGGFQAPNFLRFAMGNELGFLGLAILFSASGANVPALVGHVLLFVTFVFALRRLRREGGGLASHLDSGSNTTN